MSMGTAQYEEKRTRKGKCKEIRKDQMPGMDMDHESIQS